jgi:hypothetical protein
MPGDTGSADTGSADTGSADTGSAGEAATIPALLVIAPDLAEERSTPVYDWLVVGCSTTPRSPERTWSCGWTSMQIRPG